MLHPHCVMRHLRPPERAARGARQEGRRCRRLSLPIRCTNDKVLTMNRTPRPGVVALSTLVAALVASSGAIGSDGTLPARSAVAVTNGESAFLFTTRFCEPGTCLEGHAGVTKSGRATLPVLVAASGQTIRFKVAFAASSLRLTVRASGWESTTSLADGTWRVPRDLPLPASLQLDAASDTHQGTFAAILDRTAPSPSLYQPRIRLRHARPQSPFLYDVRFQLCSQQTGTVHVELSDGRGSRKLRVKRVSPATHTPGCRSYLVRGEADWTRNATLQVILRARVAQSLLSSPRRLMLRTTSG